MDGWFQSHYEGAASILVSLLPAEVLAPGHVLVDFGCGDGATSLGVAARIGAAVIGVDLMRSFDHLAALARNNLDMAELPRNLSFREVKRGEPLPFADGSVDLVYSWSVFEHVADPLESLRELRRITKRGGRLFVQVEPLFHGPYGSHLQRLMDEPWAHLALDEPEFLRRAAAATDHVPADEQDVLYRTHAFEEMKGHLLNEYRTLNRMTAEDLLAWVSAAGFQLEWSRIIPPDAAVEPDSRLVARYTRELLMANQVVLLARAA
jgi:SAM-dependent methyltransferase